MLDKVTLQVARYNAALGPNKIFPRKIFEEPFCLVVYTFDFLKPFFRVGNSNLNLFSHLMGKEKATFCRPAHGQRVLEWHTIDEILKSGV